MKETIQHNRQRDRGQVAVMLVLAMGIFLLGFIGLATDYTNLWFQRQAVQGAADATCQAGAMDLLLYAEGEQTPKMNFTPTAGGTINCASAPTAAPCIIAKRNGYDGTLAANNVVMTFPKAVAGAPAAPSGVAVPYIQVDVTEQAPVHFSRLLTGKSTSAVHASATCGLSAPAGPIPIVVLHPTEADAINMSGTPAITVIGGPQRSVQVNSSSTVAVSVSDVDLSQAGPSNTGGDFAVFGGPATPPGGTHLGSTGNWIYPATPVSDPYAQVSAPAQPGTPGTKAAVAYRANGCPDSGGCDEYTRGYYPGGITVKNKTAIFDPGLYYVVGGLTLDSNSNVRTSTAVGDGSGGVMFYFSGAANPVSVNANSGKGTTIPYHVDGSLDNGVASLALQCPGGAANPPQLPATVNGNILLGPCSGAYGDPSGQYRGFVFFQDRSKAVTANWGGGGKSLVAGLMYFHHCRADGTGLNCSQPPNGYGTITTLGGNSGSGAYTVGSLITDTISMHGTPEHNHDPEPVQIISATESCFPEVRDFRATTAATTKGLSSTTRTHLQTIASKILLRLTQ